MMLDKILASVRKLSKILKIVSMRTIVNFYLAISLSKKCIKFQVALGNRVDICIIKLCKGGKDDFRSL